MKYLYFILCLIFIKEQAIGQSFIRLSDGTIISQTKSVLPRRTITNVERGILVSYEFDYVEKKTDGMYKEASIIRIDGFGQYGETEFPALPIKIDRFVVPSKNCNIYTTDSAYIELSMEISPARPPMVNGANELPSYQTTLPVRPYQGLFPDCVISNILNPYRNNFIADIYVTPVQYDYVKKRVRIFSKLSYLVDFGEITHEKLFDKSNKKRTDLFLSNIVMNQIDSVSNRAISSEVETPKYLILSIPEYSNAANMLADWRRTMGYDVDVVYQNTWTETDVFNVVASSNINNTLGYLLILGDYENIPGKMVSDSIYTTNGWEYYTFTTDYYYGCVQQNTYPDIRRGRLSVSSSSEAMRVVKKIIQYEKCPVAQQSFYETGLHCAFFQDENKYSNGVLVEPRNGIEDVRFTLTSENIRDYMVNEKGKSINRVYYAYSAVTPQYWNNKNYGFYNNLVDIPSDLLRSNNFLWNGNSTDITQNINDGAFYVLHRDHGSIYGWGNPSYSITHVNNLSNGDKLPVVFSMNCLTGRYNGSTCFAESFLRKEGGGCVAIYAASETSFSGYNDALTIGMFDAIWPSSGYFKSFPYSCTLSLSSTPTYTLGDILDIGLSHIQSIYDFSNNNVVLQHTKEIFHCFGDPAMQIYTEKPSVFNNVSFTIENNVVFISVPESGKITFYNPITGAVTSFEGSNAQFPYDTNLRVSITGHNKVPIIIDSGILCIQNDTLSGNISYESDTIKVGSHVTLTKPEGDVLIKNGITKLKGNVVELAPGTIVEIGAQLEINY